MTNAARFGLAVDDQQRRVLGGGRVELDRGVGSERLQPVLARDLDDLGLGAGAVVREHGLA